MKIVFMGTPDFAVPTLQVLCGSEHQVTGVVTQPDKAKGRSGKLVPSPVKEAAQAAGIPVFQPDKVKDASFLETLNELNPDVIVVVAYGKKLPPEILNLPKYGCLNVHASLLPKLRGAAPIQWSVINGDEESGVTIQQMDEGIDTGDILMVEKCRLDPRETGGSLFDRLSVLGGPLILKVLEQAESGSLHPVPQKEEDHTYAKMLNKDLGKMDFGKTAVELERLIRGLTPWPSAYTYVDGRMLKIWDARVTEGREGADAGTVIETDKKSFTIQTGEGGLQVFSVQMEGKKRMDTEAFLRGYPMEKGKKLGDKK